MGNDVTINGRVAPYRRDLEGRDLAYEFHLMLSRLEIGDTLVIPHVVFVRLGPDNEVTPPPYPHTRWRDEMHGKYALDIEAPEAQPGSRQAGETHGEVRHGS